MQPIGTDHHIEAARGRSLELDVDPSCVLGERRNRIAKEKFGVIPTCLVEDGREDTTRQFDLVPQPPQSSEIDMRRLLSLFIKQGPARNDRTSFS